MAKSGKRMLWVGCLFLTKPVVLLSCLACLEVLFSWRSRAFECLLVPSGGWLVEDFSSTFRHVDGIGASVDFCIVLQFFKRRKTDFLES